MPRDTLTLEQIVTAAVGLLDDEGLEGLNMRALGNRLDSAATAVYWHVGGKDDLVRLAADSAWHEVGLPDPGKIGWRAAAEQMARRDLDQTSVQHNLAYYDRLRKLSPEARRRALQSITSTNQAAAKS